MKPLTKFLLRSSAMFLVVVCSYGARAEDSSLESAGKAFDAAKTVPDAQEIALGFAEKLKDYGYDTSALGPAKKAVGTVGKILETGALAAKTTAALKNGDVRGAATEVGQYAIEKTKDLAIEYGAKAAAEAAGALEGPFVATGYTAYAITGLIRDHTTVGQAVEDKIQEGEFEFCEHTPCRALLDNPKSKITINTPKRTQDAKAEAYQVFSGAALKSGLKRWDQQQAELKAKEEAAERERKAQAALESKNRVREQPSPSDDRLEGILQDAENTISKTGEFLDKERISQDQDARRLDEDIKRVHNKVEGDRDHDNRIDRHSRSVPLQSVVGPPVFNPDLGPTVAPYSPTPPYHPAGGGSSGRGSERLPTMGYKDCSESSRSSCNAEYPDQRGKRQSQTDYSKQNSPYGDSGGSSWSDAQTEAGIRIPGAYGR